MRRRARLQKVYSIGRCPCLDLSPNPFRRRNCSPIELLRRTLRSYERADPTRSFGGRFRSTITDVTIHPSDSIAQHAAEPLILAAVSALIGVELAPSRIDMGEGVRVELDGASADRKILVEAYAHIGRLRGAQPRKLASDAFKLVWAGQKLEADRLIIAVIDEEVEAYLLRPKAWLTAALRDAHAEAIRVAIDADAHAQVVSAQLIQFR